MSAAARLLRAVVLIGCAASAVGAPGNAPKSAAPSATGWEAPAVPPAAQRPAAPPMLAKPVPRVGLEELPVPPVVQRSVLDAEGTAGVAADAARPFPPTAPMAYIWWLLIMYMFYVMAIVCDDYLVPTVDLICERFSIPEDVAGATLVAFACNGPELLTNTCAIFITQSSVGMGTIVGSAIFNVMCIVGVCPLCTPGYVLDIPKSSFLRDAGFSGVSIVILWWALPNFTLFHANVLFGMAFVYVIVVAKWASWVGQPSPEQLKQLEEKIQKREARVHPDFQPRLTLRRYSEGLEPSSECPQPTRNKARTLSDVEQLARSYRRMVPQVTVEEAYGTGPADRKDLWALASEPKEIDEASSRATRVLACAWAVLERPTTLALYLTIPDVRIKSKKRLYLLAFFLSMAWLSATAFVVCIGSDYINVYWGIPQSFLGLTLAAVGTSFPNMFASMVTAKQGRGPIAVSNALGSNVQNVFFVLAFPIWVRVLQKGEYVMGGNDINTSIIWMGITLGYCVVLVAAGGFKLTRLGGWSFVALYFIFVVQTTICA